MICVLRSNMFTTYVQSNKSGQGKAAERRASSSQAERCPTRGCEDLVAQVQSIGTSSLSISRTSRPARSSGRGSRSDGTDHAQVTTQYDSPPAHTCRAQRLDYWHARHASAGCVFERAKKAWLSGAQDAPHCRSLSTIRLIDYSSRARASLRYSGARKGTLGRRQRPRKGV